MVYKLAEGGQITRWNSLSRAVVDQLMNIVAVGLGWEGERSVYSC